MSVIEPVNREADHPERKKKYSSSIRLWHWVNMIVISGSLITVLINSTLTDKHNITTLIQTGMQKAGVAITSAQAKPVAGAIEDNVWGVHIYFGYCLAGLLLFRIILEFFEFTDQKLLRRIKTAYARFYMLKKNREIAKHELVVKLIYAAFYCLLIIMVVTGLSLAFDDDFAVLRTIHRSVKSVHGFCMYLVLAFIVVHLAGVFLAERKRSPGIISDMINGGNDN